jgi:hypothetical protein
MPRLIDWSLAFLLAGAAPAGAQVGVVPVQPVPSVAGEYWRAGKPSSTACIDVSRIAGAVVVNPRTLDVVMKGGKRWRLTLGQQCPQLSYYGGFYYQPTRAGQFCAGQDRIMGRAGGACRVSYISPLKKLNELPR